MPGTRGEKETAPLVSFYSLVIFVLLFDQISKSIALTELVYGSSVAVLPGIFHLTLIKNTGIAFGFFRQHEGILLILITLSIGILIYFGYRLCITKILILPNGEKRVRPPAPRFARWGLALILGGAIGNWIDRIRFGAVVDFLDFRVWPVFNLADSAITIGVCLYLLVFFKKSK